MLTVSSTEFSLFQVVLFGAFCAASASFLTAIAGEVRRARLRYQLRLARQSARHANYLLSQLQQGSLIPTPTSTKPSRRRRSLWRLRQTKSG